MKTEEKKRLTQEAQQISSETVETLKKQHRATNPNHFVPEWRYEELEKVFTKQLVKAVSE